MKNLTTNTIILLIASSIIFFFLGRFSVSTDSSNSPNIEAPSKDVLSAKGDEEKEAVTAEASIPEEEVAAVEAPDTTAKIKDVAEVSPIAAPKTKASSEFLPRVNVGISDKKISEVLSMISKNLEDKKLDYISSKMQDCSGIFHQLKDSIQQRLPAIAAGSAYQYPSPSVARSSRQIADWYYKNNNLLIVQDPIACKNSIRPGSVMFFGKTFKKFNNLNIDMLTDRQNNYTSNGAIQHIAVVTSVTTDAEGNVIDYTMMHGRRPGKTASRSGSKEVQSRNQTLPAFGHWGQQWVGVANIMTPGQN